MKSIFGITCILIMSFIWGVNCATQYFTDRSAHLFILKRIIHMQRQIQLDTEQKLKHINKYIEMHVGTLDFELGLIAGAIVARFRHMLQVYKRMTTIQWWQRDTIMTTAYVGIAWDYVGKIQMDGQLYCMSNYNNIIVFKHAFEEAVQNYMITAKKLRDSQIQCKKEGVCRRAMPDEDEATEIDYFGHAVPKDSNKADALIERYEKLENETSLGLPFEMLDQGHQVSKDQFTKINDWLRYLAKGGLEKNRAHANASKDDDILNYLLDTHENKMPQDLVAHTGVISGHPPGLTTTPRYFNPHMMYEFFKDSPDYSMNKKIPINIEQKRMKWGEQGDDEKVKQELRKKYFEKMRDGFDPKREGIDIDLTDII